jgi:hypothetical protein
MRSDVVVRQANRFDIVRGLDLLDPDEVAFGAA